MSIFTFYIICVFINLILAYIILHDIRNEDGYLSMTELAIAALVCSLTVYGTILLLLVIINNYSDHKFFKKKK